MLASAWKSSIGLSYLHLTHRRGITKIAFVAPRLSTELEPSLNNQDNPTAMPVTLYKPGSTDQSQRKRRK
jgi:hypothetical protein